MEWSKLKNIIIILLILVNLFLLFLAGGRQQQKAAAQEQLRSNTLSILEKRGIAVDKALVPWDALGLAQITTRDAEKERIMVEDMLGAMQSSSTGIATEYQAARGIARFYPDGRFLILPTGEGKATVENPARHATDYIEKLGFALELVSEETVGNEVKIRFLQLVQGAPVFSCAIEAEYRDGQLVRIQGWRLLGELRPDQGKAAALPASTLLLRFAQAKEEQRGECKQIKSITPGYLYATASLSSTAGLLPVWQIESDTGERFFLNCETGELEEPELWLHGSLFYSVS